MSTLALIALPLAVVAVAAAVVLVVVLLRATPGASLPQSAAAARRHAVTGGALAVVAAFLTAPLWMVLGRTAFPGDAALTLTAALLPMACGLTHTAVLAATELTWPRPRGARRTASLRAREISDVTPARLTTAAWGALALLVVICVAGSVTGDSTGRSLTVTVDGAESIGSPYPGWLVGVPLLAAVALNTMALRLSLRLVVTRPAVVEADRAVDDALRRASAHRLLRGSVSSTLLTAGPVLDVAGITGQNGYESGPLHAAYVVAAALGVLIALPGLAVLCVPAPRVPHPAPATTEPTVGA